MGDSDIEIVLHNQLQAYYPGDTVVGRVVCTFNTEHTVRAIRIRYKGEATTRWSVKRGKHNTTYRGDQLYFREELNLLDGGEDNITLPAGVYDYPFSYVLPQQIPSSFHEYYGRVTYSIKAVADLPWKFDYEEKFILKVVSPLNLNFIPGLREPITDSVGENISFCCWNPGPINFTASLSARGFVPGQSMGIGCYVRNISNVSIERVAFYIVQEIEFIATRPRTRKKSRKSTLVSYSDGGIGAHAEKSWTSPFKIPGNTNFPHMTLCEIINISYRLKIELILPGCYSNIKMKFPITIGTVPLSGIDTNFPSASAPPINNAESSAPPSYSEALQAM